MYIHCKKTITRVLIYPVILCVIVAAAPLHCCVHTWRRTGEMWTTVGQHNACSMAVTKMKLKVAITYVDIRYRYRYIHTTYIWLAVCMHSYGVNASWCDATCMRLRAA